MPRSTAGGTPEVFGVVNAVEVKCGKSAQFPRRENFSEVLGSSGLESRQSSALGKTGLRYPRRKNQDFLLLASLAFSRCTPAQSSSSVATPAK
jgi:hypothetical protein